MAERQGTPKASIRDAFLRLRELPLLLGMLAILPLFIPKSLATEILIYGLFATGFNLLLGYTGMLSFGHALYFGTGAYATGMALRFLAIGVWPSLALGVLAGSLCAGVVGLFSIKKSGVYFAMISMAFAQMSYFLVMTPLAPWTGGEDGFTAIPKLALQFPFKVDLADSISLYYFVFCIVSLALFAIQRIVKSPFGHALRAIRENEERISACGYGTLQLKFLSLIFSGCFSALAGGLYTVYLGYVPVSTLFWLLSGTILMMTLLGGMRVFTGPIVGVAVFLFLQNTISTYTDRWQFYVGALFMIIVMVFPEGIMGTFHKKLAARRKGA